MEIKQINALSQTSVAPKLKHAHTVTLVSRSKVSLTGVENVLGASEEIVNLVTTEGTLSLFGKDLKIQKFSIEEGLLVLAGTIDCIKYAAIKMPLLKRLFK